MTDEQREKFNDDGFNFEYDYGTDAREEIGNANDNNHSAPAHNE